MSEFTALGIAGATLLTGKSPLGRNDTCEGEWLPYRTGEVKSHLEQPRQRGVCRRGVPPGQLYALSLPQKTRILTILTPLLARVRAQLAVQLLVLPAAPTFLQGAADDRQRQIDQAAMVQEVIQRMSQSTSQKSRGPRTPRPMNSRWQLFWCEVLQREQIGLNDNFFEVGAAQSRSLLHRRIGGDFKVTVPIAELFRLTTVKRIAGYLQAMQDNARAVNQTQQRDASRSRAQQRLVMCRHQRQR